MLQIQKTTNSFSCTIYFVSFRPRLSCLSLNTPKPWLYMAHFIHFFYIWREIWMYLISHNLMAFSPIWMGFWLKISIFIGEHCYTKFNVKNKMLSFGAKFKRCLWRHTANHKCFNTTIKCGISQKMFMPIFVSFEIICMSLWTEWEKKTPISDHRIITSGGLMSHFDSVLDLSSCVNRANICVDLSTEAVTLHKKYLVTCKF